MSALSGASAAATLPASTLPLVDPAREPTVIRNGNAAAKKAYDTGLAFEDMLVNELAQEMTKSVSGLDSSAGGPGATGNDGLGGSDPSLGQTSLGAYSSMLPQALSSDIMSAGGTGLALQIARSLDPALDSSSSKSGVAK